MEKINFRFKKSNDEIKEFSLEKEKITSKDVQELLAFFPIEEDSKKELLTEDTTPLNKSTQFSVCL